MCKLHETLAGEFERRTNLPKPKGNEESPGCRNMSKLSSEEREILEALEKDELKRSKKAAITQKRHQEFAEAMFRKDA